MSLVADEAAARRAYARAYYLAHREETIARVRRNTLKNAERVAKYQREYRLKNAVQLRAYKEANKERHLSRGRAWYKANADKKRAYSRKWADENRLRRAETQRLRQARKRGAAGWATVEQVQARRDFYGGCCAYCGAPATTLDHVIPICRGGTNWPANLRPACHSCNSSKRDLSLATFLERILNV